MSHFYGTLDGNRGEATRCGSKDSGLRTTAASWAGAIKVELSVDDEGRDCFEVRQIPWRGKGVSYVIAKGLVGEMNYERELA